MRRREFMAGFGCAALWPRATRAQQGGRVRRLGVLSAGPFNEAWIGALQEEMTKLGRTERRNLRIDARFAEGDLERVRNYARELARSNPDAIAVSFGAGRQSVQAETQTIPIVMAGAGDVIVYGAVKNLARPEGNMAGLWAKWKSPKGEEV